MYVINTFSIKGRNSLSFFTLCRFPRGSGKSSVAKLDKLRRQLQRTFSKGKAPEMGAKCCKGDAYVNQVEAVRRGVEDNVRLCLLSLRQCEVPAVACGGLHS